ncbi:MAG: class I SAM-dependent methyltransferase [Peptococcaceae bacterium]|nr:class I SAM-dependent methyltransferase [Peptococcaceae bacterium]
MSTIEKDTRNQKLENLFLNYYKKTGLVAADEPLSKNNRERFLRERFIERILFTTLEEAGLSSLSGKKILLTGLSQDLVSFFLRLGTELEDITLADLCPQALEQAKANYSDQLSGVKIYLDSFPLADNTFDLILCLNYLSNIPSNEYIGSMIQEFNRILKPEGLFLVNFTTELADRDSVQSSGVLRLYRPEEAIGFFDNFRMINLLDFIPYTFDRFRINEEPSYPKKIGFIEDLLIEQRNRYSEALLILSKKDEVY